MSGADKVRYSIQEVLSSIYDEANKSIKASVDIEGSTVEVGAVQIEDPDTPSQKVKVDAQQRLHTRANMQVLQSDVSTSNPVPTSIMDEALAYDDVNDLWRMTLVEDETGWLESIDTLLATQLNIPLSNLEAELQSLVSLSESLELNVEPHVAWKHWSHVSDPLPALPATVTLDFGATGKLWDMTNDDSTGPTGNSLEYSLDGGISWAELKKGESLTRTVWTQIIQLRRAPANAAVLYRVDAEGEA